MMLRIQAPHFVAGIVINDFQKVSTAAPIVKYMLGWHVQSVREYCSRKYWQIDDL